MKRMLPRGLYVVGGALLLGVLYLNRKRLVAPARDAKPISLDELVTRFSADSDRMIVQETKERRVQFVSGRLTVQLAEDGLHVLVRLTLYFQDATGSWVEQSAKNQLPAKRLTAEALAELKQRDTVTYAIEAPEAAATAAAGDQRQGG